MYPFLNKQWARKSTYTTVQQGSVGIRDPFKKIAIHASEDLKVNAEIAIIKLVSTKCIPPTDERVIQFQTNPPDDVGHTSTIEIATDYQESTESSHTKIWLWIGATGLQNHTEYVGGDVPQYQDRNVGVLSKPTRWPVTKEASRLLPLLSCAKWIQGFESKQS